MEIRPPLDCTGATTNRGGEPQLTQSGAHPSAVPAQMILSNEQLRIRTEHYWMLSEYERMAHYLEKLLPYELAKAWPRLPKTQCHWLVLLVGYSFEPLLQAICAYNPTNVLLVLNRQYSEHTGYDWGRRLVDLLGKFAESPTLTEWPELQQRVMAQRRILPDLYNRAQEVSDGSIFCERPEEVFDFLRRNLAQPLRDRNQRIILDITGAKKSMVAGAYLFAAYTNVPVSYVDFDIYNVKQGKPYGYSCRIGLLANPYESFRIRDWQRVRALYDRYAFRSARETLQGIIDAVKQPVEAGEGTRPLFSDTHLPAMECLARILQVYEYWDNGDLRRAKNETDNLPPEVRSFQPPQAVIELGDIWPHAEEVSKAGSLLKAISNLEFGEKEEGGRDLSTSLYLQDQRLVTYAYDELDKIRRLIKHNEDWRSAFLRAAGLHETLLKARAVRLWYANKFSLEIGSKSFLRSELTEKKRKQAADRMLAESPNVRGIIKALCWTPATDRSRLNLYDLDPSTWPEANDTAGKGTMHKIESTPQPKEFWVGPSLDIEEFPNLRNKAIHFCLSVSKEIAESARDIAEANLKEFEQKWLTSSVHTPDTEKWDWEKLCEMCGLDFLPPQIEKEPQA